MLRFSGIIMVICTAELVFASAVHKHAHIYCGENEVLNVCANRVCEYRRCADVGQPIECIKVDHKYCVKGCVCRHKYLRADNGTCIPANQCPNARKCPKPNEYYDPCPPKCPSRTCAVLDTVTCPEPLEVGDPRCPPPSCRCQVGFYRDIDGSCVTWNLCKRCPENERSTPCIQSRCERRECCDLLQPVACVRIDPKYCTEGCLCVDGYLRSANGKCVPTNQCPEAQCGQNEVFDLCPPTCPGEECGVDPRLALCLPNPTPGDLSCQPRCRCCEGYLRNATDQCIPEDQCPPICGDNEVYDPCIAKCPPRTCDSIDRAIRCPPQPKPGDSRCEAGCRCAENYYRNDQNCCVPRSECQTVCGANEVYDSCIAKCPPRTCDSIDRSYKCPPPLKPGNPRCEAGCRCADNYYRNDQNCCVPRSECPPVCGPNEVYDTNIRPCQPQTCEDVSKVTKCSPKQEGEAGCRCIDNYLRNRRGVCIPKEQCVEETAPVTTAAPPGKRPKCINCD